MNWQGSGWIAEVVAFFLILWWFNDSDGALNLSIFFAAPVRENPDESRNARSKTLWKWREKALRNRRAEDLVIHDSLTMVLL
jgi:hypothetical protein